MPQNKAPVGAYNKAPTGALFFSYHAIAAAAAKQNQNTAADILLPNRLSVRIPPFGRKFTEQDKTQPPALRASG